MYATYTYKAGSTSVNILNDITLLLTGTTNKASLSSDCVQDETSIVSIEPAGWSIWDASAAALSKVYRAPYSDDAASFKYLRLTINTNTYIVMQSYESWDTVGKSGTNEVNGTSTTSRSQRINITLGGRLDIRATARTAIFYSLQTGGYGASTNYTMQGIFERTRVDTWDTIAAGYPKWLCGGPSCTGSGLVIGACRTINNTGADVTAANALCRGTNSPFDAITSGGGQIVTANQPFGPNANKKVAVVLYAIRFTQNQYGVAFGDISSLCGIYLTGSPLYNYDTIVSDAGDTYICWVDLGLARYMIKVA